MKELQETIKQLQETQQKTLDYAADSNKTLHALKKITSIPSQGSSSQRNDKEPMRTRSVEPPKPLTKPPKPLTKSSNASTNTPEPPTDPYKGQPWLVQFCLDRNDNQCYKEGVLTGWGCSNDALRVICEPDMQNKLRNGDKPAMKKVTAVLKELGFAKKMVDGQVVRIFSKCAIPDEEDKSRAAGYRVAVGYTHEHIQTLYSNKTDSEAVVKAQKEAVTFACKTGWFELFGGVEFASEDVASLLPNVGQGLKSYAFDHASSGRMTCKFLHNDHNGKPMGHDAFWSEDSSAGPGVEASTEEKRIIKLEAGTLAKNLQSFMADVSERMVGGIRNGDNAMEATGLVSSKDKVSKAPHADGHTPMTPHGFGYDEARVSLIAGLSYEDAVQQNITIWVFSHLIQMVAFALQCGPLPFSDRYAVFLVFDGWISDEAFKRDLITQIFHHKTPVIPFVIPLPLDISSLVLVLTPDIIHCTEDRKYTSISKSLEDLMQRSWPPCVSASMKKKDAKQYLSDHVRGVGEMAACLRGFTEIFCNGGMIQLDTKSISMAKAMERLKQVTERSSQIQPVMPAVYLYLAAPRALRAHIPDGEKLWKWELEQFLRKIASQMDSFQANHDKLAKKSRVERDQNYGSRTWFAQFVDASSNIFEQVRYSEDVVCSMDGALQALCLGSQEARKPFALQSQQELPLLELDLVEIESGNELDNFTQSKKTRQGSLVVVDTEQLQGLWKVAGESAGPGGGAEVMEVDEDEVNTGADDSSAAPQADSTGPGPSASM